MHSVLQQDVLGGRVERDRRHRVLHLRRELVFEPPARLVVERADGSHHRPVVGGIAPARDVERAPAREQVEDVVRVEELRAPAEQHEVDPRRGRRARQADELRQRGDRPQRDRDAVLAEAVADPRCKPRARCVLDGVGQRQRRRLGRDIAQPRASLVHGRRAWHRGRDERPGLRLQLEDRAVHELTRVRVGERRVARDEPEEPDRKRGQLAPPGRRTRGLHPVEAGRRDVSREDPVDASRGGRQHDAARLHRGHVPVVEVALEGEAAAAVGDEPERAAEGTRARRPREEDGPRDLLVEPGHRVLEGHAQRTVVHGLDADLPAPGRVISARAADVPHLGPRVGRAGLRIERVEPGVAEVLRTDRPVVAPAQALAEMERPDAPVRVVLPRLGEVGLDAAAGEARQPRVELVRDVQRGQVGGARGIERPRHDRQRQPQRRASFRRARRGRAAACEQDGGGEDA